MSSSYNSRSDTTTLLRIREHQLDVKLAELDKLQKYTQFLESTVPHGFPLDQHRSSSSDVVTAVKASKKVTEDLIDLCVSEADMDDDVRALHGGAFISKGNSHSSRQQSVAVVKPADLYHIRPIQLNVFAVPSVKVLRDLWISRRYIARYFGGNRIRDRTGDTKDGVASNMLYVDTRINIFAPRKAGEPGFMSEHQYLGEYKLVNTKPTQLTAEEWGLLPEDTRTRWVQRLVDQRNNCVQALHACIRLRDCGGLDTEPTRKQIQKLIENDQWRTGKRQLRGAFERGEERMWIWGLECITFDFKFQEKLVRAMRDGAKQDQARKRNTTGSKRKRAVYEEPESGSDFDRDD